MKDADHNNELRAYNIDFSLYTSEESIGWMTGAIKLSKDIEIGSSIVLNIDSGYDDDCDLSGVSEIVIFVVGISHEKENKCQYSLILSDFEADSREQALKIAQILNRRYNLFFET